MINVNQITSQLARMPDQALQQYAMMHKNDPYTVSLALSESNRRKERRIAAQGQQGMGEQPKVVDQGIAEMMAPPPQPQMPQAQAQPMPEDVGIGALPAPNMQGMAEGGIVAFGDGGDVQRFAGVGPSLVRSTTGGKDYFLDVPETIRDPSVPFYRLVPNPLAFLAGKKFGSRDEAVQAYDAAAGTAAPVTGPTVSPVYPDESQRGAMAGTLPSAAPAPPAKPSPAPRPPADEGLASLGGAKPRAAAPAPATPTDFAAQIKAARAALPDEDKYAAETTALGNLGVARAEANKAALAADNAKFDKAYEGREGRLSKREEEIGKQKESNTGLALLNAGLAIMSTPGGLAAAIGKGARVGTEQFAAGLDKIRAAQERLDDARDKAEDLKLNRAEMSAKEIRQVNNEIYTAKIDAKKLSIAGAREAGAKNDKIAEKVVDLASKEGLTREEIAGRERAARITAGATVQAAGLRADLAGDRLTLDTLRAQQRALEAQLKAIPDLPSRKAARDAIQTQLNTVQTQLGALGGATIPAPSAVPPPGGNQSGWGIKPIP